MQRIRRIDETSIPEKTAALLATVKRQMGSVPNLLATLAQSPAALGGYLGFAGALASGRLPASLREQLALTVAGANHCDYCASAHALLGSRAGLSSEEIQHNLNGQASDPRAQVALRFANRIIASRGNVSDEDLVAVRASGFSDEEIVEIVANTVLNIFTNYFNHVAATDIDFPVVQTHSVAA